MYFDGFSVAFCLISRLAIANLAAHGGDFGAATKPRDGAATPCCDTQIALKKITER
jgi:hypothetical protein